MSIGYDLQYEAPPIRYRTPEQICSDIRKVSEKINEINEMLNIRSMIAEIISEESGRDFDRKIEAVNELLEFTADALLEMKELDSSLDELKAELFEAVG